MKCPLRKGHKKSCIIRCNMFQSPTQTLCISSSFHTHCHTVLIIYIAIKPIAIPFPHHPHSHIPSPLISIPKQFNVVSWQTLLTYSHFPTYTVLPLFLSSHSGTSLLPSAFPSPLLIVFTPLQFLPNILFIKLHSSKIDWFKNSN